MASKENRKLRAEYFKFCRKQGSKTNNLSDLSFFDWKVKRTGEQLNN